MNRKVIFRNDLEAKALEKMAKNERRDIRSQTKLARREDLTRWKSFHLDYKGAESQKPDNGFESKRGQSIYMKFRREKTMSEKGMNGFLAKVNAEIIDKG
jgi:hypothetical protein